LILDTFLEEKQIFIVWFLLIAKQMKRAVISILLGLMYVMVNAQVPQGFNYQAIARDGSGNPIANTTMIVRIGIVSDTLSNIPVWVEDHSGKKTNSFGLFSLVIGSGIKKDGSAPSFADISWTAVPLYIRTWIYYQNSWENMGAAKLWSVPYSLVAGELGGSVKKLAVVGDDSQSDEALFEVKRKDGATMFAVYNHGVRVNMPLDTLTKSRKGGFAIGGFDKAKGIVQEYFIVNPDSIRAYIDTNPVKSRKGGFAIGGFDKAKGGIQDFLTVSTDSIRMFIDDNPVKARKGGFAIGGFDKVKGKNTSFLNVATDESGIINPSQNRILWYPLKNAFLTGKVLIEKPDSVGVNSFASGFESKAKGGWSQALGYQSIARGNYSTAIGKYAVSNSPSSFAFGNAAQALNESSFAFGTGATATGINSYAFGSIGIDTLGIPTGQRTISSGNNSIAIGMGSQSTNLGAFSFGIGNIASGEFSLALGYESRSPAHYGVAIGRWATAFEVYSVAIGDSSLVTGHSSVAIGKNVKALGRGCLTLGNYSESWGYSSIAIGTNAKSKAWAISIGGFTSATGFWSTAIGYKTSATALYSNAFGRESVASGENSLSFGRETVASGENSFASGYQSKASGNYSFSFGYRSESNNFSAISLGNYAIASGYSSYSLGYNTKATGGNSTALGYFTTASGMYSLSAGYNSVASGGYAFAMGDGTISSGNSTTALGSLTTATGQATTSLGSNTYASGSHSVSMGLNTTSQSFCSLVLGRYNTISGTTYSWIATEPLFVIGNGTSSAAPSDAFTVLKNGNVGINTSTPSTKLDIAGGNNWDLVNGDGDLRIGNSSYRLKVGVALEGGGRGAAGIMQDGQTGGYNVLSLGAQGNYLLYINGSSQNVGIGTNTPAYKLTVMGTAWCSSGAWTGSDIRWKKNISALNNTLPGILKLQTVTYNLRTDEFPKMGFESGRQIGLIAQDVEKVFPFLVNTDNNGYKAVAYDKLSAVLVEAMKEQQRQIHSQQEEIDELKTLVNNLIANQGVQENK
jgi:hypothetical protein